MPKRSQSRITKRVVDLLQPGSDVWDSELKGFGVRCQEKGKSYVLKTIIGGRQKWITIGRHGSPWTADSARSEALKLLGQIAQGTDPTAGQPVEKIRVKELCQRYIDQYAIPKKKASSALLDRKNIDNHVVPLLGGKLVKDIKSTDIETFKSAVYAGKTAPSDPIAKRKEQGGGVVVRGGAGAANRCLTLLSTMMNLAELWGARPKGSNPVRGVPRYRETPKERFLSAAEFERLGAALDKLEREGIESRYALAAFRLLILTGARRGEIQTLKWEHVQLDRARLRLPDSKTGAKNIALPEPAVVLLRNLPRVDGNPYVIAGGRKGKPLANMFRPWTHIMQAAELQGVRIHDLRHSFASLAIQNGVSLSVIGSLLGHRSTETTKRYAHLADDYLQAESEKIGRLLSNVMNKRGT